MKRTLGGDGAPAFKRPRAADDDRNLMVNFLPDTVDEEALRHMFAPCGELDRVKLVMDAQGKSKCYGFVKFMRAEDAQMAIKQLHGLEMPGTGGNPPRRLRVAYANDGSRDKAGGTIKDKVYIAGFGAEFTEDQLRALCADYGTVRDVRVLDREQQPKGVGFVTFSSPTEAQSCIDRLDGLDWNAGAEKGTLVARYAKAKADPRAQAEADRARGAGRLGGLGGPAIGPGGQVGLDPVVQQALLSQLLQAAQLQALLGGGQGAGGGNTALTQALLGGLLQGGGGGGLGGGGGGLGGALGGGGLGGLGGGGLGGGGLGGLGAGALGLGGGGGLQDLFGGGGGGLGRQGAFPGGPGQVGSADGSVALFVRGFAEADEFTARQLFQPYGYVTKVDIPRDTVTQRPRNFCFVYMQDISQANAAIAGLNGAQLADGRTLQVDFRQGRNAH